MEELADIILSADIETVEAVQRRYGEQVKLIYLIILISLFIIFRLLIIHLQHLLIFV